MRTLMTLLGTVVFGGLLWTQSAVEIPDEPLARIQVVDEQGQPIRTAKVHVLASMNDTRYMATAPAWQAVNARGVCVVEAVRHIACACAKCWKVVCLWNSK